MNSNIHNFHELRPRIIVMGVGGAGGNAVNNMIASGLHGVEFVAANTDAQALSMSGADFRLQLGANLTEGLGAGSNPEIGEGAAEEVLDDLKTMLTGAHMVFIACGMGGGTGTGAAPVIARIAQDLGVLTVAVVTKPFQFEGQRRMRIAEAGIEQLRKYVDTMIVIPNQNLFRLANEQTTFSDSFCLADSVLNAGVACVTDLIMKEGLINLDFADVKTVITEMGAAVMGTGVAHGEGRARKAAEEAITNPLIDDISLSGAKGLLISISGGQDMTLFEVDEVASRIRKEVDPDANIIVGATFDDQLEGYLRVSLVASGLNHGHPQSMHEEADRRRMELDAEREQNSLGLNDRLSQLDHANGHRGAQAGAAIGGAPQGSHNIAGNQGGNGPHGQAIGQGGMANNGRLVPGNQGGKPVVGGQGGVAHGAGGQPHKGNVQIVNKPPRFMNDGGDAKYSSPPSMPVNDRVEGRSTGRDFVAGAPETISRPMRRMPNMEDLPITGQKQLRAYEAPPKNHGIVAQKKKVGFFDRLTGRSRREEAASHPEDYSDAPESSDPRGEYQGGRMSAQADEAHDHFAERDDYYNQRPPAANPVRVQETHEPAHDPHVAPASPRGEQPRYAAEDERTYVVPSADKGMRAETLGHERGGAEGKPSPKADMRRADVARSVSVEEPIEEDDHYQQDSFLPEEHHKSHAQYYSSQENGNRHESNEGNAEEWSGAEERRKSPAERYPTLELSKGSGQRSLIDDEDEPIADIPPFLRNKKKG